MRRILLALLAPVMTFCAFAQDADKIAVSPYVAPNSGVPPASEKVLEAKLKNVITSGGFGATSNERFILTAHVTILSEDITPTAPPLFSYTLCYNLYFGDGVTGQLFSSTQVEAKGVGETKDKAYLMALKALNPKAPELKEMLKEGKQKVIDYYNMNGAAILTKAQALMNNQDYDAALFELNSIPSVCTELYAQAQDQIMAVYDKKIAQEGADKLAQARALWSAGMDREAADKAGAILVTINPDSPQYAEAEKLSAEMAKRVKELDNREWELTLQKQRDETALRKAEIEAERQANMPTRQTTTQNVTVAKKTTSKSGGSGSANPLADGIVSAKDATALRNASIKAARDIAVAYAKKQPKTIYGVSWW